METNPKETGTAKPPDQVNIASSETEKKASLPSGKEKSGSILLQKIGLSLLFLLIGALVVTLALYLPTASQLREAQAEVQRLSAIEEEHTALKTQFSLVSRQSAIYKTISSMGLLEAALLSEDSTRISQQLRYVEDDLNRLEADDFAEIQQRLLSQFRKVKANALSDRGAALNELRVLLNDLLLFADNLP